MDEGSHRAALVSRKLKYMHSASSTQAPESKLPDATLGKEVEVGLGLLIRDSGGFKEGFGFGAFRVKGLRLRALGVWALDFGVYYRGLNNYLNYFGGFLIIIMA